ncbi:DM13 domain-containing protein [Octadecabacter sp.]|nr:DM13 domain-containing protein [Octadecabacter sp.]
MQRRTFIISGALMAAAAPVMAGGHGRTGTFSGKAGHAASGTAEIDGGTINLLGDFSFDGAPDARIALGNNGAHDPATLMGLLKSNTGASSYSVPAGIDSAGYTEVWIWCEQYSVPLGVAEIN